MCRVMGLSTLYWHTSCSQDATVYAYATRPTRVCCVPVGTTYLRTSHTVTPSCSTLRPCAPLLMVPAAAQECRRRSAACYITAVSYYLDVLSHMLH